MWTFQREWMGLLGLGIVWTNTGLILAKAILDQRKRDRFFSELRGAGGFKPVSLQSFTSLPFLRIEQGVKTKGDKQLYFHDRARFCGGEAILLDGSGLEYEFKFEENELDSESPSNIEVWLEPARVRVEANRLDSEFFAENRKQALSIKGARRMLNVSLSEASQLWFFKAASEDSGLPTILSEVDPGRWLSRARLKTTLFIMISLVLLVAATALCFIDPFDSLTSKLGGIALLAYFLGIQPIGVQLEEALRYPPFQLIHGIWTWSDIDRVAPIIDSIPPVRNA